MTCSSQYDSPAAPEPHSQPPATDTNTDQTETEADENGLYPLTRASSNIRRHATPNPSLLALPKLQASSPRSENSVPSLHLAVTSSSQVSSVTPALNSMKSSSSQSSAQPPTLPPSAHAIMEEANNTSNHQRSRSNTGSTVNAPEQEPIIPPLLIKLWAETGRNQHTWWQAHPNINRVTPWPQTIMDPFPELAADTARRGGIPEDAIGGDDAGVLRKTATKPKPGPARIKRSPAKTAGEGKNVEEKQQDDEDAEKASKTKDSGIKKKPKTEKEKSETRKSETGNEKKENKRPTSVLATTSSRREDVLVKVRELLGLRRARKENVPREEGSDDSGSDTETGE